jgi:anti-anti-sigma factor
VSTPISFEFSREPDGRPVLRVVGEIDRSNSGELATAVDGRVEREAGRLTVDLSRVAYLDSAGLSVLFARAEAIEVVAAPLLAPVLEVSGLGAVTVVRYASSGRR